MLTNLTTERLLLVPVTMEIVNELVAGKTKVLEEMGFTSATGWPTEDTKDIFPFVQQGFVEDPAPSGFEFWLIVEKESNQIIGDTGFHGKPNERGEVEIGYGLVESVWNRGYGFEAEQRILEWVKVQPDVKVVRANCLIDNVASKRILEKLGMQQVKEEKGLLYFEKRL